jgi:hypothetical protein
MRLNDARERDVGAPNARTGAGAHGDHTRPDHLDRADHLLDQVLQLLGPERISHTGAPAA